MSQEGTFMLLHLILMASLKNEILTKITIDLLSEKKNDHLIKDYLVISFETPGIFNQKPFTVQ